MRDAAEVKALIGDKTTQIVDARAAGRFEGRDADPRPGLRTGHIPSSRNVPFATLLQQDGTLKPAAELRELFARAGVDAAKPVVATCGSGVTAGVIALALGAAGTAGCRHLRRLLGGVGRGQRYARRDGAGGVEPVPSPRKRGEGTTWPSVEPASLRSRAARRCKPAVEIGERAGAERALAGHPTVLALDAVALGVVRGGV